jgi:hypothetical protein
LIEHLIGDQGTCWSVRRSACQTYRDLSKFGVPQRRRGIPFADSNSRGQLLLVPVCRARRDLDRESGADWPLADVQERAQRTPAVQLVKLLGSYHHASLAGLLDEVLGT